MAVVTLPRDITASSSSSGADSFAALRSTPARVAYGVGTVVTAPVA
jgi:hypothetical protein